MAQDMQAAGGRQTVAASPTCCCCLQHIQLLSLAPLCSRAGCHRPWPFCDPILSPGGGATAERRRRRATHGSGLAPFLRGGRGGSDIQNVEEYVHAERSVAKRGFLVTAAGQLVVERLACRLCVALAPTRPCYECKCECWCAGCVWRRLALRWQLARVHRRVRPFAAHRRLRVHAAARSRWQTPAVIKVGNVLLPGRGTNLKALQRLGQSRKRFFAPQGRGGCS